jgi:serine/threonine protein kinase
MLELVRNKYRLLEEIGKGKFGIVYKATDICCKKVVAVKFDSTEIGLLRHEATVLNHLTLNKCKNIPIIYWYGVYGSKRIPCIVTPYYKFSLLQYISLKNMKLTEINDLFYTMLETLRTIHSSYVIHRDIKPDNFMFNEFGKLTLIDFGLSIFYTDSDDDETPSFIGNLIYASPNVHNLNVAKAIDDVISVSYVYMYMCYGGDLQWININGTANMDNSKLDSILNLKKIENIEKNVSLTEKVHKRFTKFLKKLYQGILCYEL